MFKSGRWKGQNSKIKVMFQMQFQATQVPKIKGKGLMISLIPADIGKPVARLEKTAVVEGTCKWENPIYERVKLVKNHKMETYKEKIYYFNVASGSSKSGFVGEVGVNFADFVEATEPFQISLPLTASNSGAILHVFIQKLQRTDELRESEESGSLRSESLRLKNQTSDCSENANILDFAEDDYLSKENSRKTNPNCKENATVKGHLKPSAENHVQQRSSLDWSLGSLSDRSMADLLNSPEQTYQAQRLPEASNNGVQGLKSDVLRLERQAELSEIELESLRKQIVKENKRGQDLSRKIAELKEEKEALKTECDLLKSTESHDDLTVLLEEIRRELKQEKDLNKALTIQLRKTEESNSELLLTVEDLDRTIEEKDKKISYLSEKQKTKDSATKQIESLYEEIEIYKKDKEEMKMDLENFSLEYKYLQEENDDMSSKLENTQIENMKMQSEYSKSLTIIKENELQVKRLEEKIVNQALELSQSLDIITELETHVKSLEKELEKQGKDFEEDVQDLMKGKLEQERRVNESVSEAQNLQEKIRDLQEALKESNDELSLTKDLYEEKVKKLCDKTNKQAAQIEKMSCGGNNKMAEFDTLKKESTNWASLMSEKNVMIRTLQSELKMLRGDYGKLQQRLSLIESEKDKLQGEVSRLERDLRKKENQLKGSKIHTSKHDESRSAKSNEKNSDQHKLNKLLSEISSLDEKNKHMESELKEMQEKYSEISLRFAQVEGERQELVMTVRNLRNGKMK